MVTLEEAKRILGTDCPMSDAEVKAMLEELVCIAKYAVDSLCSDAYDLPDSLEHQEP